MTDEPTREQVEAALKRAEAATPGPWFFNSYSTVQAKVLCEAYRQLAKEWAAAGRPSAERGSPWFERFYDAEPEVCHVPAHHGDTSVRARHRDAEFIAAARTDVPTLARSWLALDEERARTRNTNRSLNRRCQEAEAARGRLAAERDAAHKALRSLACWLGVGGYNAPTVDAAVFERKIRAGVDDLIRVETERVRGPKVSDSEEMALLRRVCKDLETEVATLRAGAPRGQQP